MEKYIKYGIVVILFLVAWRWIEAFVNSIGGNTIQSSNYYAPGYPYQPYGGVWGYASPVYSSGSWQGSWNGRPRRGYPGGSQRW